MTPIVREATRADLEQFCGRVGPSVKGVVAVLDGKIIGAAGLAFKDGVVAIFCDTTEAVKPFKTLLHRGAIRFLAEAKKHHRFIIAEMDCNEPTAERWLRRLGFEPVTEDKTLWRH